MNVTENKPLLVIVLVAVITLIAQVPALSAWIGEVSAEHPHIVTIAEGIAGIILLVIATRTPGTPVTHVSATEKKL